MFKSNHYVNVAGCKPLQPSSKSDLFPFYLNDLYEIYTFFRLFRIIILSLNRRDKILLYLNCQNRNMYYYIWSADPSKSAGLI